MPTFTTIDDELALDIVDAKFNVDRVLRKGQQEGYITYDFVVSFIKKLKEGLNYDLERIPKLTRCIRSQELKIMFAEDFHNERLRKYESYKEEQSKNE